MNNLSNKVNQNAKEKYRTYNSVNQHSSYNFRSNISTINNNNMFGGNKTRCMEALNAFNSKNIDLALYIINTFDCDWSCQDQNGNTVLHHIVLCSNNNDKCKLVLKTILSSQNVKSFINIQNNEGQTAMLLTVLNGMDKIAYELEKVGANKGIEDNYGNTIKTDKESDKESDSTESQDNFNMSDIITPNETTRDNNLLKLLILPESNNDNLSSLNLSQSSLPVNNYSNKINFNDNSSDQFINMIKNNLQDMMNKKEDNPMNAFDNKPMNAFDNKHMNAFDNKPMNMHDDTKHHTLSDNFKDDVTSSTTEDFIQILSNKYKNNKNYQNDHSRDFLHKKVNVDTHPININNYNLFFDSDKTSSFIPKHSKNMMDTNTSSDLQKIKKHSKKNSKKLSKTSDDSEATSSFVPTQSKNMLVSKTSDDSEVTSSFVPKKSKNMLDSKTSDDSEVTSSFVPTKSKNMLDSETSTNDDIKKFTKSLKNKMNSTNKYSSFEDKLNSKKITQNSKSDIDTDDLMKVIGDIQNDNDMKGGTKKSSTIMGFRKLKLHSDIENGDLDEEDIDIIDEDDDDVDEEDEEDFEEENKGKTFVKKHKDDKKSKVINTDESYNGDNELSRLINSRKNEIHNEVINTIMGMLNKGEILYQNKPIESSEKNAKLIKSYLYKQVTEKNPQLTGMDKILIIQKMSKSELLDSLKKMPDLNKLEKTIEEHMKLKKEQYESEDNKKSNKKEQKNDEKKSKSTKETKSKKSKKSKKEIVETETDTETDTD